MRLRLFFVLIIIYVIAAFGWLTYSLVRFSHNEYKLKDQILKAGMQACVLRIIEQGKNDEFVTADARIYRLRQIEMRVDTTLLNRYLKSYNYGSYEASYVGIGREPMIEIGVSSGKTQQLEEELQNKIRLYMFEAILLTILVGAGIYGVYSSVKMIYNLNKQQNNFLLSVTHELKTPIAAMKLMLQTIRTRKLPEEKRMELMDKAIQNADRLNELTENMLTAMQIENDRYTYAREEFSLSDMMDRLLDHYSLQNEMTSEIEPEVDIIGDLFIIRISVNNLVENAIKYSDNKPIHLKLFTRKGKAVIEVYDQGPGVPEGERKRIFKRFYRVEDEEIRDTKGTGLGLFIVKQSIEKHKGSVHVQPNNPQGSIFRIELPLPKNE
ncbi:MAG: HAMP domain-containing histidine kinase [Flavobacteriales bacterium]|nr:HAMP domain-containing histidine kinase [Bacteroidota bacterium]MCB9241712.1 HAMP domain-containing histidine kinase [Flavobacteriales bacterium]